MEITHLVIDSLWRPSLVLKQSEVTELITSLRRVDDWESSPLNPKNRPECLEIDRSRWRIDGATRCGSCFFVVPLDLLPSLKPTRIFIFVPDQGEWPPALRTCLDSSLSAVLRDGVAISRLGISRHICRALDHQCLRDPNFLQRYSRLPFGSQLLFENIAADVSQMRLRVVPNHNLESRSLSIESLKQQWSDQATALSSLPILDISSLAVVQLLHDTIAIVDVHSDLISGTMIFKSAMDNFDHLYHELCLLLAIPSHTHIMPHPEALVTKRVSFGGKKGIMGFLLPYFPCGSI